MRLEQIERSGARFALNEITGEMIEFVTGRVGTCCRTLIRGDSARPTVLCTLLFDQASIAENWQPLSNCEAVTRYKRLTGDTFSSVLAECITCQRM